MRLSRAVPLVVTLCLSAVPATASAAHADAPLPARAAATAAPAATDKVTVKAVQTRLRQKADGRIGPKTKAAVKRFQRRHGLKADGRLTPATLAALGVRATSADDAEAPAVTAPAAPSTGPSLAGTGGVDPSAGAVPTGPPGERSPDATEAPAGKDAKLLAAIAECESGGNVAAVSASGQYRGKYQFSRDTWELLGGTGDPATASEADQDAMAVLLLEEQGEGAWPVCSKTA